MLSISNISKAYGEQVLFSGVTFNIGARDRIAVLGPNGSGKTTLFEIIAGNIDADAGKIAIRRGITIGYSKQELVPFSSDKLLPHVVQASTEIAGLSHRIQVLQDALAEAVNDDDTAALLQELGELQHRFEAADGYSVEHEAEIILTGLGFKERDFSRSLNEFSGGWLMRVSLAKLLIVNPDLLLLDEPTNHLDLDSCIWFENYLKSYQGAVLVTSHDRAFLNKVAHKIIAIGKAEVVFYNGGYDSFIVAQQKDLEIKEATAKRQELQIKKETRFIDRFRADKKRAGQVQSRIKKLEKIERVVVPRATRKIRFAFPEPVRSGEEVITLKNVFKSYDGNVVYRDLNLTLNRGDRAALVGVNGAGKTTLLKLLAGVLPFEGGERKLGHNVTTAYYAQYQLELLQPENNLLEELRRVAPDEPEQRLRGLLGAFLFSGDAVYKKVAILSGGEKSRLSIAKMLVRPANLLLMDEPTNHLDIDSREVLTDALEAYRGTLCFITHDRTLIRQIANKIIEIKDGVPRVYSGTYDEYLSWKENGRDAAIQTPVSRFTQDTSPRDIQRQRKAAEGQLRNSYYQASSPIKKRLAEIEAELSKLEMESRDLESYFSNPESYGNAAEIVVVTRRHREVKDIIRRLTEEWEKLSLEAEKQRLDYETAKQNLDEEFARYTTTA